MITAFAALTLTACGGEAAAPDASSETIDLRVTAEVNTGVNAQHITVIPNDVAPWLSHIILISDDGALYQTALDSGKAKPLGAKAIDAVGLMRAQAAGVVLTLSGGGTVSAMIESDDEGNLSPLPVSTTIAALSGFCGAASAPSDTVYAQTPGGDVLSLGVLVQESQVILSEIERFDGDADAVCYVSGDDVKFQPRGSAAQFGVLSLDGNNVTLSPKQTGASLSNGSAVTITPGLSTPGLSSASAITATTDSLGGAFRDGAIIMADADAPRLVMISAGFAQSVLAPNESATPNP